MDVAHLVDEVFSHGVAAEEGSDECDEEDEKGEPDAVVLADEVNQEVEDRPGDERRDGKVDIGFRMVVRQAAGHLARLAVHEEHVRRVFVARRENPDGRHDVGDIAFLLADVRLAIDLDFVVVFDGVFEQVSRALRDAFVGARDGRVGVDVVAVGERAREMRGREIFELAVVKRLDAFHERVVHLFAAVDRDAQKCHLAFAVTFVDGDFLDVLVAVIVFMDVLRAERSLRLDFRVEQPVRHVHGLHMLDAVAFLERGGQQALAFVKGFERGDGFFLRLLERDDLVGLQRAVESRGNHRRVAAVAAFRRHRVRVRDELGAAGGAVEGMQPGGFFLAPAFARCLRRPLLFLLALGGGGALLRFLEHIFDDVRFKPRAAVLARHVIRAGEIRERRAAVRTFVADRCCWHRVTPHFFSL